MLLLFQIYFRYFSDIQNWILQPQWRLLRCLGCGGLCVIISGGCCVWSDRLIIIIIINIIIITILLFQILQRKWKLPMFSLLDKLLLIYYYSRQIYWSCDEGRWRGGCSGLRVRSDGQVGARELHWGAGHSAATRSAGVQTLELETGLHEIWQCPGNVPTRACSLLKAKHKS